MTQPITIRSQEYRDPAGKYVGRGGMLTAWLTRTGVLVMGLRTGQCPERDLPLLRYESGRVVRVRGAGTKRPRQRAHGT